MPRGLVDLNELTLQCREDGAREYIAEAVSCYGAGAYRAAIVATWIAVVLDFLKKLRELEFAGDAAAAAALREFETHRANGNRSGLLDFERRVLEMAKDRFELLSPFEYEDLARLREDRGRCAHPSLVGDEEVYQPTAEVARAHLRNAVLHLLSKAPVQGRAALDRIMREIGSEYFPPSRPDAVRHLQHGPLSRPRDSLVRTLVVTLLKRLVGPLEDPRMVARVCAALGATIEMHRVTAERVLREKAGPILRVIEDGDLHRVVRTMAAVNDVWEACPEDIRDRLKRYVMNMPGEEASRSLGAAFDCAPLRESALARVQELSREDLATVLASSQRVEHVGRALQLYGESSNFDQANGRAKDLILPLAHLFTVVDLDRLLSIAQENSQVSSSFELPRVLGRLRARNLVPETEFEEKLRAHALERV